MKQASKHITQTSVGAAIAYCIAVIDSIGYDRERALNTIMRYYGYRLEKL